MDLTGDILALASIVKLDPAKLRPFRFVVSADLVSGVPASTDVLIPQNSCVVILNVAVDSYPQITGAFDLTRRQPYSYADVLFFQWAKDGRLITPPEDYHLWRGETFFFLDQGKLTLTMLLQNAGPAIDSQQTNVLFDAVLLPRSVPALNTLSRMSVRKF